MSDQGSSILSKKRQALINKENRLLSEIEGSTTALNKSLNKTLKRSLLVGGALVAGYAVFKIISGKEKPLKKDKKSVEKLTHKTKSMNPVLAFLIKNSLALLIDSLKNKMIK
ncbi:hypothetical protein [Reichenbachiella sp. MALMAid0571]|uniref:hypothetical protein n=1 Tax=Reichenbachiella sp. MALMAid0571 TaxID=3143939 RepID=UPI0032DF251F